VSDRGLPCPSRRTWPAIGSRSPLDGVRLELRSGERLALLGPNAPARRPSMRCISGRAVPDSGQIEMFDRPLPRPEDGRGSGSCPRRSPSIRT